MKASLTEQDFRRESLDDFLESPEFSFRKEQFRIIAEALLELNRPITIVETGCMRPPPADGHEYEDGQATLLWEWLATETNGYSVSIDINPLNIAYSQTKITGVRNKLARTNFICGDSIEVLADSDRGWGSGIDLLYLDSFDYKLETEAESCLHACGELAASWPRLNSGAIIAVDDCLGPFRGKHALVRLFCEMFTGAMPMFLSNVCAWRKP